jgi:hypothetical protein
MSAPTSTAATAATADPVLDHLVERNRTATQFYDLLHAFFLRHPIITDRSVPTLEDVCSRLDWRAGGANQSSPGETIRRQALQWAVGDRAKVSKFPCPPEHLYDIRHWSNVTRRIPLSADVRMRLQSAEDELLLYFRNVEKLAATKEEASTLMLEHTCANLSRVAFICLDEFFAPPPSAVTKPPAPASSGAKRTRD